MSKSFLKISATVAIGISILLGQQTQPKKVVFVCEHGAAKSIIAKAEFERIAKEKGIAVEVVSRGTVPDAEIAAGVRKGLLADGTDLGSAKPVKVSAKDLEGATAVVTFGPDLAEWMPKGGKTIDWSAAPSPSKDYREARDYIRKQVEGLVGEIKK
jgi:arsenate reductase (thioredoxin)